MPFKKQRPKQSAQNHSKPDTRHTNQTRGVIVDEMRRCPICKTFNPKSHALAWKGEYFCDEKCRQEWKSL